MVITNRNTWECRQLVCNGKWSCRQPQMAKIVLKSGWAGRSFRLSQSDILTKHKNWTTHIKSHGLISKEEWKLCSIAWFSFTGHEKVLLERQTESLIFVWKMHKVGWETLRHAEDAKHWLHWYPHPSYAPLTILLLSKRMHLTNSSWPSSTRKHAPHSISHSLEESTKKH